ncbi:MAG: site-2 protease family protein [bacterium]|nr:site-2 protease family protein [bacterium]
MESLFLIIVLILSVIAHEVAHGYAASALGDPTAKLAGRLTLNPLVHIDLVGSVIVPALLVFSNAGVLFGWAKPVPYNPYNLKNQRFGEAIVAVAGSATNLLLAIIFALVARGLMDTAPVAADFAGLISFVNLFLGLFNLIPFPPMDGYTVLRGILPFSLSHNLREFEDRVRTWGVGGLVLVLVVFSLVLAGPFFALVSSLFNFLVGV